jgi:hypothetical protein
MSGGHGRRPPYDRGVNPTTQAFLAALIGAVVAGGAVLAWHISDRQQHQPQLLDEPAVPAAVAAVLSVLRSSAVIVDDSDDRNTRSRRSARGRSGVGGAGAGTTSTRRCAIRVPMRTPSTSAAAAISTHSTAVTAAS